MNRTKTKINDISVAVDIRYIAGLEAFVRDYCDSSEARGRLYKVGCDLLGRQPEKRLLGKSLYLDPD